MQKRQWGQRGESITHTFTGCSCPIQLQEINIEEQSSGQSSDIPQSICTCTRCLLQCLFFLCHKTFLGDFALCVQDEAAKEIHRENRVMKKQLIGLLAKVTLLCTLKKTFNHPVMVTVHSVHWDLPLQFLCHQMVGASREELEEMGTDWQGDCAWPVSHGTWDMNSIKIASSTHEHVKFLSAVGNARKSHRRSVQTSWSKVHFQLGQRPLLLQWLHWWPANLALCQNGHQLVVHKRDLLGNDTIRNNDTAHVLQTYHFCSCSCSIFGTRIGVQDAQFENTFSSVASIPPWVLCAASTKLAFTSLTWLSKLWCRHSTWGLAKSVPAQDAQSCKLIRSAKCDFIQHVANLFSLPQPGGCFLKCCHGRFRGWAMPSRLQKHDKVQLLANDVHFQEVAAASESVRTCCLWLPYLFYTWTMLNCYSLLYFDAD